MFSSQQEQRGPTRVGGIAAGETTGNSTDIVSNANSLASPADRMTEVALRSGLRPLLCGVRKLRPIVQGGMGEMCIRDSRWFVAGVSTSRLISASRPEAPIKTRRKTSWNTVAVQDQINAVALVVSFRSLRRRAYRTR